MRLKLTWNKHSLSSKIFSKHQEQRRMSQAIWRYWWLACLLIALQVVRTSSPGSGFLVNSPPPSPPPKWSLNPLEETLPQPVLKSFITVFIQYKGIENKLTRTQLLGLAKSVYYETTLSAKGPSWVRIDWWAQYRLKFYKGLNEKRKGKTELTTKTKIPFVMIN